MERLTEERTEPDGCERIKQVFARVEALITQVCSDDWYYNRAVTPAGEPVRKRKKKRGRMFHKKNCRCASCSR